MFRFFFTILSDDVELFFFTHHGKNEERKNKKKSDVPSRIFVVNIFLPSERRVNENERTTEKEETRLPSPPKDPRRRSSFS